jgi:two-component system, NtrC family, sensor kinase
VPTEPAPRRPLRRRLTFRLVAALCAGAAAILVAAGLWNVALQREHMTDLVRASADRGADVILRSTRAAMLDNRPAEVRRILGTIGSQPGIELIRIFDKQGRISASTRAEEIGTLVDQDAEQCYGCHRVGRPLERLEGVDRVRILRKDGGRVLSVILPIRNEPDCSTAACHVHDASKPVLGVLDYHTSLAAVDERIGASERQMAVGLGATVGAVLVLAGFLMWLLVLRPVRKFAVATRRVRQGDLTASVDVRSGDELGDLAGSWNRMLEELSRARRDLEDWSRTLEVRVEEATKELDTAHRRMLVVEKMASLGKLAAVVAHEINNPLAGIATYAKLLRRRLARGDAAEDPELTRALELVESEAIRCGGIVRNLLLFSRTPGARFVEEDVRPLLERCAALVRHQAEMQDVTVRVEVEPGLPKPSCDPSQVQQVVLALAMNALEATPKGGGVALRAARDGGTGVRIEVADTGCGIAAADLPHVFEPFFTTKAEGKGVGLGLAVVYGIVERHHGRIDVDTSPGVGTTFTVRLPLVQPQDHVPEGAVA